jgi:hypothetical protein
MLGGIGDCGWLGVCIGEADLGGLEWRLCMLFAFDMLMVAISYW